MASAIAFMGVLAGCGDDVVVEPDPGITLTPLSANLQVGQTAQFSATVTGLANKTVNWTSSDAARATVDATGKVTAVSAGTASIIATAAGDQNVKASAVVTITRANLGVTGVTVSPNADILAPGQTRQLVANVTRDPGVAGTVTWSSSATNIATVSTAGVVTAVAAGSATITAASTVDPTVTGSSAITVRPPLPATISIQKVTVTGNTNQTVNFNNVAGGIDVTLNVDPGDQILQRVEVLLDGAVVCTQNFSASESEALSLAAVFEELEAVDVICQINTSEFTQATGAVRFFNGLHTLSARAIVQGGTQTATPSVTLTFNNASGFVGSITNTNTNGAGFPNSSVNPNTGQSWTQGTHVLTLAGVNYACGAALVAGACPAGQATTYTNINVTLFGKSAAATPAAGGQIYTITYSGTTGWSSTNSGLDNYQSAETGELPVINAAALSNGQNGATTLLNPPGGTNAALTPIALIRVDNVDPGALPVNPVVPIVAAVLPTVGTFPLWVTNTFAFAASTAAGTYYNQGVDSGVDQPTTTFYYIAGALPGAANSCDLTGMTAITAGSALAETIVSTTYRARAVTTDRLGNRVCRDLAPGGVAGATFGADFQVPTISTTAGPANNSAFPATPVTAMTFTVVDNASGFGATPVTVTSSRLNPDGTTSCIFGTTTASVTCVAPTSQALTFDPTAGTNGQGYYTQTTSIRDQAGNVTGTTTITFLVDVTPATFSGGLSLQALYTGGASAAFNTVATDNLDLQDVHGTITYPTASLHYEPQPLGTYGPPLETNKPVAFTISSFIRCLNAAGDFSTTTNKAASVDLFLRDFAQLNATAFGAQPIPGANVQTCNTVGNIAAADILSFAAGAGSPNYGAGKSQVDIDGATLATASATTVQLTAVANVAINSSIDPFTRVEFYFETAPASNVWRFAGTATAALSQTPTQRFWTYTFTWDPGAVVPVGSVNVAAIGIDANGDAVLTTPVVVTTVP